MPRPAASGSMVKTGDQNGKRISGGQQYHQATHGGDYVSQKTAAMVKNGNFWP